MPAKQPDQNEVRFEASVRCGSRKAGIEIVADLDLDRVPGVRNEIRVLVTAEEAARLLERGCELVLSKAHRIRPLDASLIMDDDTAKSALEEQLRSIPRQGRR